LRRRAATCWFADKFATFVAKFALLTEKQLRRGVHRSTGELERAILEYIDAVNADPRPFRWTKSAEDILATIKRFCLTTLQIAQTQNEIIRTSESAH
jgi:hypothetical protein